MQFWKMNGAGNDFIILNNLEERLPPSAFPLLAETSYFVMGSGVSGIEFYPYGGKVIFRDALAMR